MPVGKVDGGGNRGGNDANPPDAPGGGGGSGGTGSGGQVQGPARVGGTQAAVQWVQSSCTPVTAAGVTGLYDCSS